MSTSSTPKPPPALAFVDTETTGLDPFLHDAWEIAIILRKDSQDEEHVFHIEPDLTNADPKALEIGRYHERASAPDWHWHHPHAIADATWFLLEGAVFIGSNPDFDARFLAKLFGRYGLPSRPWHYRTIDIATLAVGALYGRASEWTRKDCDASWYDKVSKAVGWPWKSYDVSRHVEVEPPAKDVAHTALGDARWARDVWDAVTVPDAFYAASDDQLSAMAGEALSRRGEFIGCARTGCPNGEWQGYAVERGWTAYRGQLQCPKHNAADGDQ